MQINSPIKFIFTITLAMVGLAGCGFLGTTEEDMKTLEEPAKEVSITSGSYEEYTPERFQELKGSERFILFFHADWCPTCRALEKKIKENLGKLNGHTVLEVNYDTEQELKKEYEVMVQTTVLFIDENGEIFEKRVNPDFALIEKFFY